MHAMEGIAGEEGNDVLVLADGLPLLLGWISGRHKWLAI
jgi:hypothetical protein